MAENDMNERQDVTMRLLKSSSGILRPAKEGTGWYIQGHIGNLNTDITDLEVQDLMNQQLLKPAIVDLPQYGKVRFDYDKD